jgi:hypothetical protein
VTGLLLSDCPDLLVFPISGGVLIGFGAAILWAGVNYVAIHTQMRQKRVRFLQVVVHMVLQYCALVPQGVVALTQITATNYGLEGAVILPRNIAAALGREGAGDVEDVEEEEVLWWWREEATSKQPEHVLAHVI